MPRRPRTLSIQDLRRQLAAKERQLGKLAARRESLLSRLASVEADIAAIGGAARGRPAGRPAGKPGRKPGRKPGPKPGAGARRGRPGRPAGGRTGRPLVDFVLDVLKGAKEGMRVKDVMQAVTEAGYASSSKDFYGIVAAALRDDDRFKKLKRGVYALA